MEKSLGLAFLNIFLQILPFLPCQHRMILFYSGKKIPKSGMSKQQQAPDQKNRRNFKKKRYDYARDCRPPGDTLPPGPV